MCSMLPQLWITSLMICGLQMTLSIDKSDARPIKEAPTTWLEALKSQGDQYHPRTEHLLSDGSPKYLNRLILETSPYLMQHAHNPVNWFAWGEEALKKAQDEDKPILLSIGYSTCHWCHVMERESFEDEEIAAYINAHYVPIKVDREERPDLDDVYMKAVQALTGRGGWPMTTFLTPKRVPFFGGTYFPPRDGSRGRRRGFLSLLKEYQQRFKSDRKELIRKAQELSVRIAQDSLRRPSSSAPKVEVVAFAAQRLTQRFDPKWGGFGRSPKFPTPPNLELLLKYYKRVGDEQALHMLTHTLTQMARGGIYDHIGGGFHRYATDQRWRVPHFEKMLYDNAQLASLYLQTAAIVASSAKRILFREVAQQILDYLNREMLSESTLYYSATDADSLAPNGKHPEEGLFFTWTPSELKSSLSTEEYALVNQVYRITEKGDLDGRNIFHRLSSFPALIKRSGLAPKLFRARLKNARQTLYQTRLGRIPPLRDDKAITSWNALAISAMVNGARYLDQKYLKYAKQTARSILKNMKTDDEGLKRTFMKNQARHDGVLDDYAFFIQALLDLFEASGESQWLSQAISLQTYLDHHFWSSKSGGYYMTSDLAEQLIARDRPSYDGAEPSGNSVSAHNLMRLFKLTGQQNYLKRVERLFKAFGLYLNRAGGLNQMMTALLDYHGQGRELAIITPNGQLKDTTFIESIYRGVWPNTALVISPNQSDKQREKLEALVPWLKDKHMIGNQVTAYLCYEGICERPLTSVEALIERLKQEPPLYLDRSPEPLTP
jgi:uncharacterized protein